MESNIRKRLAAGGIVGALVLGLGVAAGAATGVVTTFDGEAEHTGGHELTSRTTGAALPADETRIDGDRTETRQFVDVPDGTTQTFAAGPAGTVTITRAGDVLTITTVSPNGGWTVEEQSTTGPEVEVKFVSGAVEVRFDAEIEDGVVRIRVRQQGAVADPTTPTTPTTPMTLDDENSGPGSSNSGPGSVDDGNHDDGNHDNSGPASGQGDNETGDDHGSGGHGSDD